MVNGVKPRLLVSVRSLEEALTAREGGADIIDIKEPYNGPLGRAEWSVVEAISQELSDSEIPTSAALGELSLPCPAPQIDIPGLSFAKIGLAGCDNKSDWKHQYQERQTQLSLALHYPQWIGVCYADRNSAHSPAPSEVLQFAVEQKLSGVLIDTWEKSAGNLLTHLSNDELQEIRDITRKNQQFLALAGSISQGDFSRLCAFEPDILAVRTAACQDGNRLGPICAERIRGLKTHIEDIYSSSADCS